MSQIDNQSLQFMPVENQLVGGCKGPIACRVLVNFTLATHFDLNLQLPMSQQKMDRIQSMYVDNRSGANVTITFGPASQFVVFAKANTQGWYNVLAPNPVTVAFDAQGGLLTTIFLVNVPIPGAVWPTV